MKRLLTKYGVIVLSLAVVIAVILSVMAYFSTSAAPLPNVAGIIASPFRSAGAAITETVSGWVDYFTEFDALKEENEEKKAARRIKFAKKYRVALRNFVLAFVPFIIMLVLGIGFCSVRYADKGGTFLVLTIVFFSLAAVALIASVVMARFLAEAARRVRVNERDTSTAIGREYLQGAAREEELKKLTEIIAYRN